MRNQLIDGSPQHELHLQRCNRKSEPPVIKCVSLVMGKKLGGQFERAASSILVELLFQRVHCTSGRDIGRQAGGGGEGEGKGGRSRNPPVSRRHRSNFCGISAEESRQPQNIRPRDARCFYKNHGDQSRSFALTRRGFFSCWLSFLTHTVRVFLILLKSDDGFMFSHFSNKSM